MLGSLNSDSPPEPAIDPKSLSQLQEYLDELADVAIAKCNVPTIAELLEIPGEEVTEAEWSTEDIVEQVEQDMQEDNGEICESRDEEESEPVISTGEALRAALDLETFILQRLPGEYDNLLPELQRIRRKLLPMITNELKQTDIRQFYTQN